MWSHLCSKGTILQLEYHWNSMRLTMPVLSLVSCDDCATLLGCLQVFYLPERKHVYNCRWGENQIGILSLLIWLHLVDWGCQSNPPSRSSNWKKSCNWKWFGVSYKNKWERKIFTCFLPFSVFLFLSFWLEFTNSE